MPREADYVTEPEQRLGAAKVAEALRSKRDEIRSRSFLTSLEQLKQCFEAMLDLILFARDQRVVSETQKRNYVSQLQAALAAPIASLETLRRTIWWGDERATPRGIAKRQGLLEYDFVGPTPPPIEQGKRLQEALDICLDQLSRSEPKSDVYGRIIFRLAKRCLKSIVKELSRLRILRVCGYCHHAFYPSRANKRFCSIDSEGRNCGGNARSRRYYARRKAASKKASETKGR